MAEFDFNDIRQGKNVDKDLHKFLTGDYIKGISPFSDVKPNIEVENNEYVKTPPTKEGDKHLVVKVKGKEHYRGKNPDKLENLINSGEKLSVPNGTQIVSAKGEPNATQRKFLDKTFGVKLKKGDSFAKFIDKRKSQIGYDKLSNDQEDLFKKLDKLSDTKTDKTRELNEAYLNKMIHSIEEEKAGLQDELNDSFDLVFEMQEGNKTPKERDEHTFEQGGTYFNDLVKKYNLTPELAQKLLDSKGLELPKADEGKEVTNGGGTVGFDFVSNNPNTGRDISKVQNPNADAHGDIDAKGGLSSLERQFRGIMKKHGVTPLYDDKGNIVDFKYPENSKFNSQNDVIKAIQSDMQKIFKANNDVFEKMYKSGRIDKDTYDKSKKFYDVETFFEGVASPKDIVNRARELDGKLGNFTSGRFLPSANLILKDDNKIAQENNIYTIQDLKENKEVWDKMSPETQKNVNEILEYNPDANFFLKEFTPQTTPAEPKEDKQAEIEDNVRQPFRKPARLFYTPDQYPMPPSPMEAHLKNNFRPTEIDPLRIGVEPQMQELSDQRQFMDSRTRSLNPAQRVGALSSFTANAQKAANDALFKAHVTNADNLQRVQIRNAGLHDQAQQINANNALSYEQRQMGAKAKTEEELKRYFDRLNDLNVTDFKNQQKLNLQNSLFPQFDLDYMGMTVGYNGNAYDPETQRQMNALAVNLGYAAYPTYKGPQNAKNTNKAWTQDEKDRVIKEYLEQQNKSKE